MNSVHQEVNHQRVGVVGQKAVEVEQEPVENVFQKSPHEVTEDERWDGISEGFRSDAASLQCLDRRPRIDGERWKRVCTIRELDQGTQANIRCNRQPYGWHNVPSRPRKYLCGLSSIKQMRRSYVEAHLKVPRSKQTGRVCKMTGLVDLLEIVRLGPVRPQNLHEERLAEVEEFILLEVSRRIRLLRLEVVVRIPICRSSEPVQRTAR